MEVIHARPAGEVFRVFPVPFFLVRNPVHAPLGRADADVAGRSDAAHREPQEPGNLDGVRRAGRPVHPARVHRTWRSSCSARRAKMATADGFALTDADFAAYNPGDFFTQTEMVDTVPRLDRVFTEDRLELLAEGHCR